MVETESRSLPPIVVAARHVALLLSLIALPAALLAAFLFIALRPAGADETIDFHVFWTAAQMYMHGHDPYPIHPDALAWLGEARHVYAYPPILAALAMPLALLPYHAAAVIFVLASTTAIFAALWLLEVRDWRCYGAVFLWPSTLTAISVGTLTPLLLLGAAVAWRYRSRPWITAVALGLTVSAKLFLWPLLLWLWVTGRRWTAVAAALTGAALAAAAWARIGFAGAGRYDDLLRRLTITEGPHSYAALWLIGGTVLVALASVVAVAVALGRRWEDDAALAAAAVASLLLTPILWLHYLLLLVLALPRRFSLLWIAPAALWLTAKHDSHGEWWRVALVTFVIGLVAAGAVAPLSERRRRAALGANVVEGLDG